MNLIDIFSAKEKPDFASVIGEEKEKMKNEIRELGPYAGHFFTHRQKSLLIKEVKIFFFRESM